ncbi:MAG: sugar ABC transporter substrate-binding protein [Chloroflexia bacterium]|nr:sugar ABC transporter substrate-binding protein [Chloroflexia bacterium]
MTISRRDVLRGLAVVPAVGMASSARARAQDSGEQVTLRVQPQEDWFAEDASPAAQTYRAAHERFIQENPNVTIEFEIIPPFERFRQYLIADEAGNPPDITFQGAANTFTLASSGRMVPLNPFMEGHPYLNPQNLKSVVLDVETVDGQYYGIPTTTDVRLLYYRKDLFAQAGLDPNRPPASREELLDYAQKLTKGEDQWGFGFIADNSLHAPHMWMCHTWAGGGELLAGDGKAIYDGPAGVAAAQLYQDLVNTLKVSPSQVISTDYDGAVRALVGGQYAMALLGSWSWAEALLGPLGEEKIGWTKVPVPAGGRDASFSGGWSWMISQKSQHQDVAWRYIEAINNEQVALTLGKTDISCWQSVLNHPEIQGTFVAEAGQYAAAASHGNPKVVTTQALFDGLRQAVQDITQGKAAPEEALRDAAAEYNSEYYEQ